MPTADLLKLKTTAGDRIYPASTDSRVWSNVGGKNYLQKSLADVVEGEWIDWHNQFIDKSIEELEPFLRQLPRYRKAEDAVYAANSKGVMVPRLRIELIRALAAKGIVNGTSAEDLERKIMLEDSQDFSSEQYSTMSGFLHREIKRAAEDDGAPSRSEAQIKAWLQGKYAGPLHYTVFYSIALATGSPVFENWFVGAHDRASSSSGFWGAYKFYTILRQTIGNRLSKGKGAVRQQLSQLTGADGKGHGTASGFDTTEEVKYVLSQIIDEVDEEFSLARVIGVEKASVERQAWQEQKAAMPQTLKKGPYTGEARPGARILSLTEIVSERNFFTDLASFIVEDYLTGVARKKYAAPEGLAKRIRLYVDLGSGNYYLHRELARDAGGGVMIKLGLAKIKDYSERSQQALQNAPTEFRQFNELAESVIDGVSELIITGKLGDALGIPNDAVYHAFERAAKLQNALPKLYLDWLDANSAFTQMPYSLTRSEKRAREHDYNTLTEKLAKRYGFDADRQKNFMATELLQLMWSGVAKQMTDVTGMSYEKAALALEPFMDEATPGSSHIMAQAKDPAAVRNNPLAKALWQRYSQTYFTRNETAEILAKHGLLSLYRFVPAANFAFENHTNAK